MDWSVTRQTPWKNTSASSLAKAACSMLSHDIVVLVGENAFLSTQYLTQVKKSFIATFDACNLASALS